ncbi:hypothetical protein KAR91_84330 [Candidatus Pacearchaeota archaeon]|nr:hypothetical protein [Candidatus Pacearchaeota archaeon]
MATPWKPIEEFIEGDACINCWGAGKTFGDTPTPERITMTGAGFAGPAAVCNGTFILTQDPGNPCRWLFDDGTATGEWFVTIVSSTFIMGISGGPAVYFQVEGLCVKVSTLGPESVSIEIEEPPTPEYKIAVDQGFAPSEKTYYRDHGAVGADKVLQVAKRLDRINIHAKYEPEY